MSASILDHYKRTGELTLGADLSSSVLETIESLKVDRQGNTDESFMITSGISQHMSSGVIYTIDTTGSRLILSQKGGNSTDITGPTATPVSPPSVKARGRWNTVSDIDVPDGNILGGCGTLILEESNLQIPEAPATAEMFAYYGAVLLKDQEQIQHNAGVDLPVCNMHIGREYAKGYLELAELGGGSYLETHDRPHLHLPCNEDAAGHILLGRMSGDSFELSAFRIPYGHALFTPGGVLHCDGYLIGDYMCIYSCTENYSTYLVRDTSNGCVAMQIVPPEN